MIHTMLVRYIYLYSDIISKTAYLIYRYAINNKCFGLKVLNILL